MASSQQQPHLPIEVDPALDTGNDNDSSYSFDGDSTTSASLASSIRNYYVENGRTYHAYREGKYLMPNDETENDRLDLQHALFSLTASGKLNLAPIRDVHNCLDVGTGTGLWALEFADAHPETSVIGVDLSPIQPSWVPPNLQFYIDDVEDEWNYKEQFDFIHSRMMIASIKNWDNLLNSCMSFLRPGGWVELQDVCDLGCEDGTLKPDSAVSRWWNTCHEAYDKMGQPIITAHKHKERLIKAGFVDVQETTYRWPLNTWPKDKHLKQLGLWSRENTIAGLESLAMAALTRILKWSQEEVKVLVDQARRELMDTSIHGYFTIYYVYGRKPDVGTSE